MKKVYLVGILVLAMSLIACKGEDNEIGGVAASISGSTSVEKMAVALVDEFIAQNPSMVLTYEAIGSSGGVKNAKDEVTHMGTASRDLKSEEKSWGLEEKVIAYDGVAVIVHPENPVINMTKEEVFKIYTGEITNWLDVGGIDQEIVVVSREDGSGTRGAFEELLDFQEQLTKRALISEGNGSLQVTVSMNPAAIGYVSFEYINESIHPVAIDGVDPIASNVLEGHYPIARPYILVYKDSFQNETSRKFLDFIDSDEGQQIISRYGINVID